MNKLLKYILITLMIQGGNSFAASYPSVQAMLEANYSHSKDAKYPWHKDNSDSAMNNYSVCKEDKIPFNASDILIVMCSDTELATSLYEEVPNDIYWIRNTSNGIEVIGFVKDIGEDYIGIVPVSPTKWAIEITSSSFNQGYLQEHRVLGFITNEGFNTIASWTALMEDHNNDDSMENTLSVEKNKPLVNGFYPVSIVSVTTKGNKRITKKKYEFFFDEKINDYNIPEELNGGY